jgi:hypothetical protein
MFGTHMMRFAAVFSALAVCPPKLTDNQVKSVQKEINVNFTMAVLPVLVAGAAVAVFKAMPHIENCLQQIKRISLTPPATARVEREEKLVSHVVAQKKKVRFDLPTNHVDKETRQTGVRKKRR